MIYFDTETHLIRPGLAAPRLVCVSVAFEDLTKPVALYDRKDGLAYMQKVLVGETFKIAGHNVFYDLGVLCAEDPKTFVPLIFKAFDDDRIRDTIVRQQLIDILDGNLKFRIDDAGDKVKTGYSLADLALRHLKRVLPKTDTWRLRYGELDGVPISQWPADAVKYACDDAATTRDVYIAQEDYVNKGDTLAGPANIPTQDRNTREAWSLWLMSAWGIRTDGVAVAKLKAALEIEQAEAKKQLADTDVFVTSKRGKQTKKMSAIYERVEAGFKAQDRDVPRTATGRASTNHEAMIECGDPVIKVLADTAKGAKLLSTYVPMLERGTVVPINARYNVLVESNRTSCSAPNCQNPPRKGGVRECFVARPGHVFCSVDYDTIELRALAQVCLDLLGESSMAVAIGNDEDLHLSLAAEMLGISKSDAVDRYKAGDKIVEEHRQLAKCVSGDTQVQTAEGFRNIRELVTHRKEGFSTFAKPLKILSWNGTCGATQGYFGGVQKVWRLTASNGSILDATADHEMISFRKGRFARVKIEDLKSGDKLFFRLGSDVHGKTVLLPKVETFSRTSFKSAGLPEEMSEDLATFLGFYVSEGAVSKGKTGFSVRIHFTNETPDVVKKFEATVQRLFGDRCKRSKRRIPSGLWLYGWHMNSRELADWLTLVGAGKGSRNKNIPSVIKNAPRKFKIAFLRALFEGDGSVGKTNRQVKYTSASETLIRSLQLELINLGIPCDVRFEYRKGNPYWHIAFGGSRHLRKFQKEIGFLSKLRQGDLVAVNKTREKDQAVLFLPSDNVLKIRDGVEDADMRDNLQRVNVRVSAHKKTKSKERVPGLSEVLLDRIGLSALPTDERFCIEQGLWCLDVTSITYKGEEEVFDLYEPETEIALFNGLVARDCVNFGNPGGLSPKSFVEYAKGFGFAIDFQRSKKLHEQWHAAWPEMKNYFRFIDNLTGKTGEAVVKSPRSGFVRGGLSFTQCANHFFQSLTATGAKDALWHVTRECYTNTKSPLWGSRPVIFLHDEVITEMPEATAAAAAAEQARIMVWAMQRWMPDIPVKAGPVLMRRWYKGAKAVYVDGKLVPSRPVKTESKTTWEPDF